MRNNTSIRVPKKYAPMLSEIDYEGKEDGYWAYTVKGFYFPSMGCHTAHEFTRAELLNVIRTVAVCDCDECKETGRFAQ